MDTSNLLAKVYELLTVYGMKVLAAIVIFRIYNQEKGSTYNSS